MRKQNTDNIQPRFLTPIFLRKLWAEQNNQAQKHTAIDFRIYIYI